MDTLIQAASQAKLASPRTSKSSSPPMRACDMKLGARAGQAIGLFGLFGLTVYTEVHISPLRTFTSELWANRARRIGTGRPHKPGGLAVVTEIFISSLRALKIELDAHAALVSFSGPLGSAVGVEIFISLVRAFKIELGAQVGAHAGTDRPPRPG